MNGLTAQAKPAMKRKEEKQGAEARDAIKHVAAYVGKTLGKTLGPAGRNFYTPDGITNDGKTILTHIRFIDECSDNVAIAFHEVANQTDKEGGDGTTTATVIAAKLVETLIDQVPDLDAPIPGRDSVMELGRKLEAEKDKAVEILKSKTVPVTTLEELEKVAFTSMEDREVAKIVADTIFKAGAHSHTALEEGFTGKVEVSLQAGIEIPVKLNYGTKIEAENAAVLVVNHLFEDYRELTPFMQSFFEWLKKHETGATTLVIVGKKFSIPFIQSVVKVSAASPLKIVCLSNDYLDDDLFEDVAAFVDAKYMDTHPRSGESVSKLRFETHCGAVGKIVATDKGAVFYGGKGTKLNTNQETTRVSARILQIQEELNGETDTKRRDILEKRIAEFKGGKATIYVDAKTTTEKYYLKLKVQDAMNSCKTALEGGMVRGGGQTLVEVADELGPDSLLAPALREPFSRIQENAGGLEIGPDVMDSALVAEAGIRNAVSVVKTVLTIEGIIADSVPSMVEELKEAING